MSERTKVRYDKLMKEREGKEKEYYEGLMRARIADEERDDRERKWQRQLGLDDYNRIRNDAKEERDRQMFELNLQLQGNKISASEAKPNAKELKQNMQKNLKRQGLKPKRLKLVLQRLPLPHPMPEQNITTEVVAVERPENIRGMTAMVTSILHTRMKPCVRTP